jgi:hypothetical protein
MINWHSMIQIFWITTENMSINKLLVALECHRHHVLYSIYTIASSLSQQESCMSVE